MKIVDETAALSPQAVQQLVCELQACKAELQACKAAADLQEAERRRHHARPAAELSHLHRVEATLLESRNSYLQLIKDLPVGVILHSPTKQKIVSTNARALAMLGLSEKQLLGKAPCDLKWDIIHSDGSAFLVKDFPVPRALASDQSVHNVIMGVYRPQHEDRIWLLVNAALQRDLNGVVCLVVATISDVTEHKLNESSKLAQAALIEQLFHRLVLAQEATRRRFSRELHERTSPNLAALRINLDIITSAQGAMRLTQAYADRIDDTRALIEDTTVSVRDICAELHPPLFDTEGLVGVLQSYARQFAKRTGLRVNVECNTDKVRLALELELEKELKLTIFRIVQEALTNCAKHAEASQVQVTLEIDAARVVASVTDDGVGFDPDVVSALQANSQTGHGLLNMRESTTFMAGRFTLSAAPGAGTRIRAEFDLATKAYTA